MARTALTPTQIVTAGIAPAAGTAADVANGNVIHNNDGCRLFVVLNNTGGSTYTCTFVTPGTVGTDQLAISDKVVSLTAGQIRWIGPFPLSVFTNDLQIDTQNAAVTIAPYTI